MTAQIPDILHYRGQTFDLSHDVLHSYLQRLRKDRRPTFCFTSTACHRRYIATWEIRDDLLHLAALEAIVETEKGVRPTSLADAFPWAGETIPATWFTGEVRCPEGRLVSYAHHAYQSVYERDRILYFRRGRLEDEHLVLNPPLPIIYRLAPDGTRTCVSGFGYFADELEDPLAGRDLEDAYRVWGQAPEGDDEDGYRVAAALMLKLGAQGRGGQ